MSNSLSLWERARVRAVGPRPVGSRFRGNDAALRRRGAALRAAWIPAYAGMTGKRAGSRYAAVTVDDARVSSRASKQRRGG